MNDPAGSEPTDFLYPFIEGHETDAASLLVDLAGSAKSKMHQSAALRSSTVARWAEQIDQAAEVMAHRFLHAGRLFTFGNGGSATDADGIAALFSNPPSGRALPAVSLVADRAVLTALSNDIGFEIVFSRQLIAHAREGDIAMGLSTSGGSVNVLNGFKEARGRGMVTIGLAGYQGGAMATSDDIDFCFVVDSDSVHRIQEAQAALVDALWSAVQRSLLQVAER